MPLTMSVDLLAECYEATYNGVAEWPPHPARAFSALVSVAEPASGDDDALRWLERQDPPEILAPRAAGPFSRSTYVPTNAVELSGGHQVYLGRTSGARAWQRTAPERRYARFVWTSAATTDGIVADLNRLARRVAYLGRSTSPAMLGFSANPPNTEGLDHFRPSDGAQRRLRVPYAGYLDQLRTEFNGGGAAWSVARPITYGGPGDERTLEVRAEPVAPAYPDLIVLGFAPGQGVDGAHALAVTRAFKAACLQRLGDSFSPDDLALVHGHHDGTRRQCAFLSLPFVGGPHGDGQVLGVAIALSPDLPKAVRVGILRLAGLDRDDLQPRLDRLRIPGLGRRLTLGPPDERATVQADRWAAPVKSWLSVFPVVLDWFPKRQLSEEEIVARGCEAAGYPRPQSVEVLPSPIPEGAPHLPSRVMKRRADDFARPSVHVRLTFAGPVTGPVIVGHLRHLGLGLCLPERPA